MTDKEAIEELKARKEHYEMGDGCEFLVEALDKGIEALEKQKTGHWIDDNDGYGTSCSECGKWYTHPYLTKQEVIYCCKCGAKMVEP